MENRLTEACSIFLSLSETQQEEVLNLIRSLLQKAAEREQD